MLLKHECPDLFEHVRHKKGFCTNPKVKAANKINVCISHIPTPHSLSTAVITHTGLCEI